MRIGAGGPLELSSGRFFAVPAMSRKRSWETADSRTRHSWENLPDVEGDDDVPPLAPDTDVEGDDEDWGHVLWSSRPCKLHK